MAGILANSVTIVMLEAATLPDKSVSGYLRAEQITLSVTGSNTSWVWGIAKPSGATVKSDLTTTDQSTSTFTPDVPGYYVVTVLINGTTVYVIRIEVLDIAVVTLRSAMRLAPMAASQVPPPPVGATLFWDSTANTLRYKLPDGTLRTVTVTSP